MEDDYEQYTHSMEDIDRQINTEEVQEKAESRALLLPSEVRSLKLIRQCRSLTALINDEAATESEKERALAIIEKYKRRAIDLAACRDNSCGQVNHGFPFGVQNEDFLARH